MRSPMEQETNHSSQGLSGPAIPVQAILDQFCPQPTSANLSQLQMHERAPEDQSVLPTQKLVS